MSELPEKIPLIILDSSQFPCLFLTHYTKYMVELPSLPSFEWYSLAIDTPKGEDLILGIDFLNHLNPSIDWRQGLITFNADHKDYHDPSNSFSNNFSSAKSCASLVGDSRTPSFLSSVHIPSLNSHTSLLPTRNEFYKEIQDVGKDNSVSSPHLFFGNMDLPTSPYHDSLEELWDEEEEPEEVETMMNSITSFLKNNSCFPLNEEALSQFNQLKEALTTAPILSHFSLPTIVGTNASNYALGAVLSHVSDSGKHPIAFDSRKCILEELNYEIHDKELLGIVWALKGWRAFLLSLSSPFEVLTDHSSLQKFMSSKFLTLHQARCAGFLSEFNFSITYHPIKVWTPKPSSNCKWSLDLSLNGFHHSIATVQFLS
ncbi:hypothetical protein O181_024506 [Austropuccinia psidii MF-1]|uniref:Reverse transcriptase RNase H-like domain-containing protein n=1 Tax=Austropuccinia psidii MF-1 TaxID=1389203 RepID=A0A9Q3CLK4_9BASI|nr:hypothetical protein [Austropuccinia psidii MF-1]